MTLADWAALDEDEPGEIVDGRLVEEEVADLVHEVVVAWLIRILSAWPGSRGGFVAASGTKLAVSGRRGRKPDLTVFLQGGKVPPRRGLVRVPPDIAVEVVSPTPRDARRDRIEKPDEYAAFGIRFYWIVDPELRSLEVLELGPGARYVRALAATEGLIENVPGCPGLALDLDAIWREADRLGPPEEEG
ncbi:MAG: Uma2 family endonuclease [Deltaproteobacteria bacterium]|nr:Uma2 family endonuclease [Deltaproteobacteria bacterium]